MKERDLGRRIKVMVNQIPMVICRWSYLCRLFIYNILFCRRFLLYIMPRSTWTARHGHQNKKDSDQIYNNASASNVKPLHMWIVNQWMAVRKKKHVSCVSCHGLVSSFVVKNAFVGSLIPIAVWSRFIVYSEQAIRSMFGISFKIVGFSSFCSILWPYIKIRLRCHRISVCSLWHYDKQYFGMAADALLRQWHSYWFNGI